MCKHVIDACLKAGDMGIPNVSGRNSKAGRKCIPGWNEFVKPAREESMFWHWMRVKQHQTPRKRCVSNRTRQLYEQRRRDFAKLSEDERRVAKRAISPSCREDYREHVNGILNDMEAAEHCGNSREVSRLTLLLSGRRHTRSINPSKDLNGDLLVTQDQLLDEWSKFLGAKFASPDAEKEQVAEMRNSRGR